MKKIFFATILSVVFIAVSSAQEVQFGIKAGVNFAKLTGDDVEDADGRTGFHLGGLAVIPISEKFAVQPEVLYSQQGLQRKYTEAGIEIEDKFILDYINVPVLLKYNFTDAFSLEAGPQIGFTAKSERESNAEGDGGDGEVTQDLKDSISGTDISVGAGATYRLNNGIFFQGRYMFGVSDIGDDDEIFGDSLTNSVLSFSLGYSF